MGFYIRNLGAIKMRLQDLQDNGKKTEKLMSKGQQLAKGLENIKQVLNYQGLSYVSKVIHLELISRHHDTFPIG